MVTLSDPRVSARASGPCFRHAARLTIAVINLAASQRAQAAREAVITRTFRIAKVQMPTLTLDDDGIADRA